jgi:hypothetical protein
MSQTLSSNFSQVVNNFRFPATFPTENIKFALNYRAQNTDKFLVTYPKCGVTWTQQIICLILNKGTPHKSDKEFIYNSFIEYSGMDCLKIKTPLNYKLIKTHLPFDLMPYNKSAKYLWVLRNPKDTCVSFYHHIINFSGYHFSGHFHEFFDYWINGQIGYGNFFQHVLSFWSHRFDDNFTFLVYEHMKNNPKDAVLKIAEFLGQEFVIQLKENNELLLNKVIENSTISAMKSTLDADLLTRKGVVGDWRNYFNKEESDLVDEKVREYFTGTGLENLWTEEMKW